MDLVNNFYKNSFMLAVEHEKLGVIQYLLSKKKEFFNIFQKNANDENTLHLVFRSGDLNVINVLK